VLQVKERTSNPSSVVSILRVAFEFFKEFGVHHMLFLEILIGMFQTGYDTLLFQTKLLHFGILLCHLLQISLETNQIIMGLPIELVELNILLLEVFFFLATFLLHSTYWTSFCFHVGLYSIVF
jgi:hypothetical protein